MENENPFLVSKPTIAPSDKDNPFMVPVEPDTPEISEERRNDYDSMIFSDTAAKDEVNEDRLAAGFTQQEIDTIEGERPSLVPPKGDGSKLNISPPNSDMYTGYLVGNSDDTTEGTPKGQDYSAWAIYNSYAVHENTRESTWGLVFDDPVSGKSYKIMKPTIAGNPIPYSDGLLSNAAEAIDPDLIADMPAGTNRGGLLVDGVVDASTNTIETAAALIDTGADLVGLDTNLTEYAQTIPRSSSGSSAVDAVVGETAGLVTSFFTGRAVIAGAEKTVGAFMKPLSGSETWRKVGQPAVDAVSKALSKIATPTSKINPASIRAGIGGEAGIVAGTDSDTPAFLRAFEVNPNDDQADQVIAAKLNIMVDSVVAAGLFGTGVKAVANTAKFVGEVGISGTIGRLAESPISQRERAIQNIIRELSKVEANATKSSFEDARKRIIGILNENQTIILDDAGSISPIKMDLFSALEVGDKLAPGTVATSRKMSAGIRAGKGLENNALTEATGQVPQQIDTVLTGKRDAALPEGITSDNVADEIIGTNTARLDAQSRMIEDTQVAIAAGDEGAVQRVLADTQYGTLISDIAKVSPSEVSALPAQRRAEIAQTVMAKVESMNATKNDLYDAIPEGAEFDIIGFGEAVAAATKDSNAFSVEGMDVLNRRLIATIRSAYKTERTEETVDALGAVSVRTFDLTPEELAEELLDGGVDFKVLYADVRPKLSQMAEDAFSKGEGGVGIRIRGIIKNIDGQVDYVAENGSPEAAAAAREASDYYTKTFAPLLRDGPGADSSATFKSTRNEAINRGNQSEAQVEAVLDNGTRRDVAQLKSLLDIDDTVGDATSEAMEEYIVSKILQDTYEKIQLDGLQNIDVSVISQNVRGYSDRLRGNMPILAAELDGFIAKLQNAQNSSAGNDEFLATLLEQQTAMQEDALSKMVRRFTNSTGDAATVNPEGSLRGLINSPKGADDITELLEKSNNNPIIVGGLKKQYLEELRQLMFTSQETTTGDRMFNPSKIRKILENNPNIAASGRALLKDDPDLAEVLDRILTLGGDQGAALNSKTIQGGSGTPELQAYQGAVNRLIFLTVGPLNKTGTKIRALSNLAADKMDITNSYANAMDMIVADAPMALEVLKSLEPSRNTVGIGKVRVSPETINMTIDLMVKAGLLSRKDVQTGEVYTVIEAAVDTAAFAEATYGKVKDAVTSIPEQMGNLFGGGGQ